MYTMFYSYAASLKSGSRGGCLFKYRYYEQSSYRLPWTLRWFYLLLFVLTPSWIWNKEEKHFTLILRKTAYGFVLTAAINPKTCTFMAWLEERGLAWVLQLVLYFVWTVKLSVMITLVERLQNWVLQWPWSAKPNSKTHNATAKHETQKRIPERNGIRFCRKR